jgi:radical SAM superfamily enzyme YgiQ (UPF0313 family)
MNAIRHIGLITPSQNKVATYFSNNPHLSRFFAENPHIPGFFHPNLALLTLAALTPEDIEVQLVDERVDTLTFEEDFDIVGITIMTAQAPRGYEIAREFRKRGVYTILGGIHPTVCPEEASLHCDTLIVGEAENTWPRFLDDFKHDRPKKIYRDHSVDLSKSPIPRYDLVDASQFHLLPVQATRGCPYDCSFCSVTTVFGPQYRVKSTPQIIREVEAVQRVAKNPRCVFNDDNMFVNRKRAYEILEAMKPLRVKYFAQTDVSIAEDERLLKLLRESGCVTVFIGFESLVPENLAMIQKTGWKLDHLETYSESCKRIQSYGIQVLGSFVVGLDYDTRDSLLRLRDFVLENRIWAQFLFLTPFPGTRARDELIEQGRLSPSDTSWDLYTCYDTIFEPASMTMQELEETVVEIWESVYTDATNRQRMRHMVDQRHMVDRMNTRARRHSGDGLPLSKQM